MSLSGCRDLLCNHLSGSGQWTAGISKRVKGNSLESYNAAIRKCAAAYGCRLIDLRKMNVMYETMDGCHPNVQGMYQLAVGWIQGLLTNSVSVEKKPGNLENKLIVVLIFSGDCIISFIVDSYFRISA